MSDLEIVWEQREEIVYPKLFGSSRRGIFTLSMNLFSEIFQQSEIDPRWLHYGVFEFGPTPNRASWIYITSGCSNPWEQEPDEYNPDDFSGFGTELVFETSQQADWAVGLLQRLLAFNILLAHGRLGDRPPLDYGDRIPLNSTIDGSNDSSIRLVALTKARHYSPSFKLDSGSVDLLHAIGISESERDYAKQHGTDVLIELLRSHAAFPITDPTRASIV